MASDLSLEEIKNEQVDLVRIPSANVAALLFCIIVVFMDNLIMQACMRACQIINLNYENKELNVLCKKKIANTKMP